MTITSNIHYNLTAWAASTAYATVGQRRSLAGNAFEVITAGTSASSGGPSGTSSNITDGTVHWKWLSAINYTTLIAWEAAISPTTLSQPVVALVWAQTDPTTGVKTSITTTTGTAFFELDSCVPSAANTLTVTCAPGESIRDSLATGSPLNFDATKGVSFLCPAVAGNANYVYVNEPYCIIDGLQFKDPLATSNSSIIFMGGTGNLRVQNCIFDGYAMPGGVGPINSFGSTGPVTVANCLFVDRCASPANSYAVIDFDNPVVNLINNTIIGLNSPTGAVAIHSGLASGGTSFTVRNNIVIGYAPFNTIQSASMTISIDYSVFSAFGLTSGHLSVGSGVLYSKTAATEFISTTVDFRIKPGSGSIAAGIADTTNIPSSDDMARSARGSVWDIGADQFTVPSTIAASGGSGNLGGDPLGTVSEQWAQAINTLSLYNNIIDTNTLRADAVVGTAISASFVTDANPSSLVQITFLLTR